MKKNQIRKKIFELRKKNFHKNLSVDFDKLSIFLKQKKTIGGYYPYNYEIDTINILKELEKRKFKISLPKIEKNNQMNFYNWSLNDPLMINHLGIPEPISKKIVYPEILLVPLVSFDIYLNRIGYGGGYYDRYLTKISKKKKIFKIGLAYSFQKIKKIPINEHDIKLDCVITEKEYFK